MMLRLRLSLSMANPNGNYQSLVRLTGIKRAATPLKEARALQRLMFDDANDPNCKPSVRALLARSWCLLQDTIRVMRGVPSPGQLRPDLDPVQMARMLKRAKARKPIDLEQLTDGKFYDDPEPDKIAPKKESLSNDGGVTGRPGGEGEKTDGGSY